MTTMAISSEIKSTHTGAHFPSAGSIAHAALELLTRAQRILGVDPEQAGLLIDRASDLLTPRVENLANPPWSGLAPWQAAKVSRYIDENFDRPISNTEMADLARLSVAHFSKCFKKSFGSTPREYLVQIRLQHAKTLMTGTSLSLSRIALDCGFCDQPHFCRTFQQAFGWTPNHWRKVNTPGLAA